MPGRLSIYNDKTFKEDVIHVLGSFKDEVQHLVPNYNTHPPSICTHPNQYQTNRRYCR